MFQLISLPLPSTPKRGVDSRADVLFPLLFCNSAAKDITFNTTNPLRRDTLNVSPGTWVVVRVITDIVGVAAFHW